MIYTDKTSWKPNLKQEKVLAIPDSVLEKFFGGSAGPGKTELGIVFPVVKQCKFSWYCLNCKKLNYKSDFCVKCEASDFKYKRPRMWYEHPQFKGLIIRRTIPELKKELTKRTYQYYPQTGAEFNKSDRVWTWPEFGSQLFLSAAEHEEDVRKYDTEQFTYEFFEELTSFLEFQYMFMLSRCRPADEDLPGCVYSASNPGNIGHGWVRKRFVEPFKDGGKIIRQFFLDKQGNPILEDNPQHFNFGQPRYIQRIFVKALPTDNPHLLKNDPDYINKLHLLPEAEKAAKLYGDWWTFSGQVFDSFRTKRYPDEPENALHVIPSFTIPSWWPRILAIDWGYKAATVGYWAAISPSGRVYIYREYYVTQTDVAIWGTEIGQLSIGENIRAIVLDTNAWDSRGEEKTIAQQFVEHFNATLVSDKVWNYNPESLKGDYLLERASKARVSGKILVQEYLRWHQKPTAKSEDEIVFDSEQADRLRRLSESAYNRYVELFTPPKLEENIPKLQIIENACPRLVECIPLCVYDENNVEDVKEWQLSDDLVGDDPYDCLRYLLKRCHRYFEESKNEFEKRDREQQVVEHLAVSGDMTAYYRRMEKLELSPSNQKGPVKNVARIRKRFKRLVH